MKKLSLGTRVRSPHGSTGTVVAIFDGLDASCERGWLGPTSVGAQARRDSTPAKEAVTAWLEMQVIPPKTPRDGMWYAVRCDGGGGIIVGELDLEVFS